MTLHNKSNMLIYLCLIILLVLLIIGISTSISADAQVLWKYKDGETISYANNGDIVAVGTYKDTGINIYKTESNRSICYVPTVGDARYSMGLSKDGSLVAVGDSESPLSFWSTATCKLISQPHSTQENWIPYSFISSSQLLATYRNDDGVSQSVGLINISDGSITNEFTTTDTSKMTVSLIDNYFIPVRGEILQPIDGQKPFLVIPDSPPHATSLDGSLFAILSTEDYQKDGTPHEIPLQVWRNVNAIPRIEKTTLVRARDQVQALALSPTGEYIAVAEEEYREGSLLEVFPQAKRRTTNIWRVSDGALVQTIEDASANMTFSTDGKRLLMLSGEELRAYGFSPVDPFWRTLWFVAVVANCLALLGLWVWSKRDGKQKTKEATT